LSASVVKEIAHNFIPPNSAKKTFSFLRIGSPAEQLHFAPELWFLSATSGRCGFGIFSAGRKPIADQTSNFVGENTGMKFDKATVN
jgi:hypothetical protein